MVAEALDTENPPIRLHAEAVGGMLPVGRDLKTEMLDNSKRRATLSDLAM